MVDSVNDDVALEADDKPQDMDEQFTQFKRWFRDDDEHCSKWLEDAKEDFKFFSGDQYTEQEKLELKKKARPDIVFNRLAPMVRSVAGYQANQKLSTICKPTEPNDEQAAEVANQLVRWFRDQSDMQFTDGDAFQDTVICGMGWADIRLDYDEDPFGDPFGKRLNPLNMRWDHQARERNLKDARRVWQVIEEIPLTEAKEMFDEEYDDADYDAKWALDMRTGDTPHNQDLADQYASEGAEDVLGEEKLVTLVRLQWWEREDYYRVLDPFSGELTEVDAETHDKIKSRLPDIQSIKQRRKVYRQAYLGNRVLEVGPAPCKNHFSMQCITGFRDQITGLFHGLVTGLKDPQRWANKWMSQTMHILNSTSKGGVMVEKDAVENMRQFKSSWAKQDEVTVVKNGTLSQGKIDQKPQSGFPAGFYQLMEMAINSMRDVSGVNLEMLGQRDANQPGVVETQRRSAAMTTLTTMFECMRLYRRTQGELILSLVKDYIPKPVLSRVIGEQATQILPSFLSSDKKYDIIVDEAPDSPNAKDMIWQAMGQSIHQQPPAVQAILWKYSPLPGSAAKEMQDAISSAMQPPPPDPAMQMQMEMEMAKTKAEVEKARLEAQGKASDVQVQQYNVRMKELDYAIAQENARVAGVKANAEQIKAEGSIIKTGLEVKKAREASQNTGKSGTA